MVIVSTEAAPRKQTGAQHEIQRLEYAGHSMTELLSKERMHELPCSKTS